MKVLTVLSIGNVSAEKLFRWFFPKIDYQPNWALGWRNVCTYPISKVGKSGVARAKRATRQRHNYQK